MFKLPDDSIYIIPSNIDKSVKIIIDYGQCPKCGKNLIDLGKYGIWDDEKIIDEFDKRHCLYCENTWFLNGKGKIEFAEDNSKMIYINGDMKFEFKLKPYQK